MTANDSGDAPRPTPPEDRTAPGEQTLSQVLARILDQLSVSAWLPAGALVFLLLLVGNLRAADGDLGKAIGQIAKIHFPAVLLLVGAVIVATVVTQAFEFETIRLFEWYWRPGALRSALATRLCRRQSAKREELERQRRDVDRLAFCQARLSMRESGIDKEVVDIVEGEWLQQSIEQTSPEHQEEADDLDWRRYAPVRERHELAALDRALRDYPSPPLILPTRLGNTLMAYEELLHDDSAGPFEGVVMERLDQIPPAIQREHDQFRSRLDLYCSLLLVFLVSGVIGVIALAIPPGGHAHHKVPVAAIGITALSAIALASMSYRAAIVSARKYGYILEIIANLPKRSPPS